jgi:hypothetical protein
MMESGKKSKLIADKNSQPHSDHTHQQKEPDSAVRVGVVIATFLGGGGIAGIAGLIARMLDRPGSIWAAGTGIVCLLITMATAGYELYPTYKNLIVPLCFIGVFVTVIFTVSQVETFSEGVKTKEPTPISPTPIPEAHFHEQAGTLPEITLGEHGATSGGNRGTFFNFGGFKPFNLYLEDGELQVDARMWGGKKGLPPVELHGLSFVVRPEGWDKNFINDRAFEVVNENDVPMFQLIRLSPSHFVIKRIFETPSGLILASDNGMDVVRPPWGPIPSDFKITRIFKYPSWKYPGKYVDNSN